MIFDKEFVMYLTKYIGENNSNAKKYLNAYYMKFLDLKNEEFLNNNKVNVAYRFWNFKDTEILKFIFGGNINVYESGFLSYFSNIGNTKFMMDFLEINNPRKLFYLIEEQYGDFLKIYTPLEHIDRNEYTSEELDDIDEVLEKYKKENEHVKLKIESYNLNLSNTKAILIHEWLGDLIEFKNSHKFNNGYYYVLLTKENINLLRNNEFIEHIKNNEYIINSIGCSILDEYYTTKYLDYYNKKIEEKKPKKIEEISLEPVLVKFKKED